MAFCRLVFPLLVLSVICVNSTEVPVYLWGDLPKTSIKSNPLTTVSTNEFEDVLKQELADEPMTVVFIEETLSVEDLSRRNKDGETAYPFLHENLKDAIYLPSVKNALRALKDIAVPAESDFIQLTENGLSEELPAKSEEGGRFVFINLKDAKEDETRSELLQRHDEFMQKTLSDMQQSDDKVVGIYTAHYPSWTIPVTHSRARRAVAPRNESNTYIMDGLRLYASRINVITDTDRYALSGYTTATTTFDKTNNTMSTKMNFENASLTLNFNSKGGYWFFNTVTIENKNPAVTEELYPAEELFAILGFSYRCGSVASFSSVNESKPFTVRFEDIKIQPFFETSNTTQEFGDSFNCVGFFTAPIWAGLFVVFILLLITFYGIMMMMDIRTMDRFDDPKGKTITINAGE